MSAHPVVIDLINITRLSSHNDLRTARDAYLALNLKKEVDVLDSLPLLGESVPKHLETAVKPNPKTDFDRILDLAEKQRWSEETLNRMLDRLDSMDNPQPVKEDKKDKPDPIFT